MNISHQTMKDGRGPAFDEHGLQLAKEIRSMLRSEDMSPWRDEHSKFVLDAIAHYTAAPQPAEQLSEGMKVSDGVLSDALTNLEHDNYERSQCGYRNRQADIELIRAELNRYGALQSQDRDLQILRALAEEYNELIRHLHSGGDALEFISRRRIEGERE